MRTTFLLIVFFSCFSCIAQTEGKYHFQNVNVLSMVDGNSITEHVDVLVSNGVIEAIGRPGDYKDKSYTIIEADGMYLMPGISEMHAHIPTPKDGDDAYVRETLFLYLSNGITTIRGMLGAPYHLELKKQIDEGQILSPRVYTSSPSLNGNSVKTAEEAHRKVLQYKNDGYDFLKIHPGITLSVMEELVKTADEAGIRFAGHVPFDIGLKRAIEYGFWSVDHADGFVEAIAKGDFEESDIGFFGSGLLGETDVTALPDFCRSMAANDVYLVPTQSLFTRLLSPASAKDMIQEPEMAYMPSATRYSWVSNKSKLINDEEYDIEEYNQFIELRREILQCAYQHDVQFILGSDAPQIFNVPGFSIQHEMQSLVDAEIPIYDVLLSGTTNPAKFFGAEGQYGQVTNGASADLILLEKNPLQSIENMKKIAGVMVRGQWLSREDIDARLAEIATRHAAE